MPGKPENTSKNNESTMNFWERLYLPEILKGLSYTFGKMRGEKVAVNYPEETWYPPDSYRGRPVLVEEAGQPRCVACGLCAKSCPPLAISMQATETEDAKERTPEWFEINMLRCIYCGFCEDVCPEEAIIMSKEYDMVFRSREEAKFGMDRLLIPKERLKDRLDWLEDQRNPQSFGKRFDFQEENNIHAVLSRDFIGWLRKRSGGISEPQESVENRAS